MGQLTPESLPFRPGWFCFELPGYRPHPEKYSTYSLFSYDELPTLPEERLKGKLQWLQPLDENMIDSQEDEDTSEENAFSMQDTLAKLLAEANQLGLTLPDAFLHLMSSPILQSSIPSCTACYFDLSPSIVACPGSKDGYIIRFLDDQQWCLLWYLYLTPNGDHCVLVSGLCLDQIATGEEDVETFLVHEDGSISDHIYYCAPSFEAFLYRFWLENRIWFKHGYRKESYNNITEEEEQYLEHYKRE